MDVHNKETRSYNMSRKDAEIIIKELYDARLTELNDAGIIITLAELLKYYQ